MPKRTQQILAFLFGVVFIIVLLVIAIAFPKPTSFQYTVFRVVLALAAAGAATMIPGFLQVTISDWLRAGGALAVFVIVFFYNPAMLIIEPEPDPTTQFQIVLACGVTDQVILDTFTFPYSDMKKKSAYTEFVSLLSQLPNQSCDQTESTIFRTKDEAVLTNNGKVSATSGGNLGVIVVPAKIITQLGGNHLAFTKIHSQFAGGPAR
jgi:hypothetical protein